jgi:hypothetical protein
VPSGPEHLNNTGITSTGTVIMSTDTGTVRLTRYRCRTVAVPVHATTVTGMLTEPIPVKLDQITGTAYRCREQIKFFRKDANTIKRKSSLHTRRI